IRVARRSSSLCPYPSSFRARDWGWVGTQPVNPAGIQQEQIARQDIEWVLQLFDTARGQLPTRRETATGIAVTQARADERFNSKRSEEHTSELQSRENLVCRL